ncbi:Hypothetical Protein FCC1311_011702 [Hondaea fermentalgiana]|uniref:Uncharacterized protein n=1 Tax=Hondaea fermentalgiana TaxID=2315210 RepID=A0A2R5G8Z2_9STRA|nr:Hypothetical Protein FCC1311_011702 [Hondaea fermentalgiana]|eukprot:GBG24953.1 Hypothetical Protein FCC1311_011702 [Hondaea fermentalgiana]
MGRDVETVVPVGAGADDLSGVQRQAEASMPTAQEDESAVAKKAMEKPEMNIVHRKLRGQYLKGKGESVLLNLIACSSECVFALLVGMQVYEVDVPAGIALIIVASIMLVSLTFWLWAERGASEHKQIERELHAQSFNALALVATLVTLLLFPETKSQVIGDPGNVLFLLLGTLTDLYDALMLVKARAEFMQIVESAPWSQVVIDVLAMALIMGPAWFLVSILWLCVGVVLGMVVGVVDLLVRVRDLFSCTTTEDVSAEKDTSSNVSTSDDDEYVDPDDVDFVQCTSRMLVCLEIDLIAVAVLFS